MPKKARNFKSKKKSEVENKFGLGAFPPIMPAKKVQFHHVIILDKSGSMSSVKEPTLS